MKKVIFVILCLSLGLGLAGFQEAGALNFWDFNPGRIIDDEVFYNPNTMTVDEIQRFLDSKVPVCETNWESHGYMTAVAPCLKDYKETTKTRVADQFCKEYVGKANQSAAEIIWGVGQACGINPQAILVILQKEQGLVTDTWPRDSWLNNSQKVNFQYRSAMGYGCPDTAACDSEYYGFFNQVYYASRQYKRYKANPDNYSYRAGRNNAVQWNPNGGCGSSNVYIENQATAGLYNYTPYRPNDAALNAQWGTGDGCSSYGNRNFWAYFTSWFGSTRAIWTPLDRPRYMQVKKSNTNKIDVITGKRLEEPPLEAGRQISFIDKLYINGKWLLRTEWDKNINNLYGIPQEELEEIPFTDLPQEVVLRVSKETGKFYPSSHSSNGERYFAPKAILFAQTIEVAGERYYRTAHDKKNGNEYGIPVKDVEEFVDETRDLSRDITVTLAKPVDKIDMMVGSGKYMKEELGIGRQIVFAQAVKYRGEWYYRTRHDMENGNYYGIRIADLFIPLEVQKEYEFKKDISKTDFLRMEKTDQIIEAESVVEYETKYMVDGAWYLRSNIDSALGNFLGVAQYELW